MEITTSIFPIYAWDKTYAENFENGPNDPEIPLLPERELKHMFLGYKTSSLIGVASGPLLSSKWVLLASKMGYDLLSYKTIRAYSHPSHALPNICFLDTSCSLEDPREIIYTAGEEPKVKEDLMITNSFGNPSQHPDFYLEDISFTLSQLEPGKVLIVSVFGTGDNLNDLSSSYSKAARGVAEAGAHVIELNLSCPNVTKGDLLYLDTNSVERICRDVSKEIRGLPLIIKVGPFPNKDILREILITAANSGVHAMEGLNTLPRRVKNRDESSALGPARPFGGVCGAPIRTQAIAFAKNAIEIVKENQLSIEIIGVGGIVSPEHFDQFLELGCSAAMTATGMMWCPTLAYDYHVQKEL